MMAKNSIQNQDGAANKSRSVVPIPDTIESIRGYPKKLVIFKVPASPYWWVRYYDEKPIKRTTKTTNKAEAIKAAKAFYEDLLVNKKLGKSNDPKKSSFIVCAEGMLREDELKAKRGELSESYVTSQKATVRKNLHGFFRSYDVGDIDYAVLDQFKTYLFEKDLAPSSIKINFVAVKKVLDYAQRHNYIKSSPLLPKVKNEDNPRSYFPLSEYRRLRRQAWKLIGARSEVKQQVETAQGVSIKKLRNIDITEEIAHLIQFMVYTFIRPTDVKNIKHRHIEVKRDADREYLWMPIPPSKKHDKPITSMPQAARVYKKMRALRLQVLGDPKANIDDEYIFQPEQMNRRYAYRKLTRQFEVILNEAGLKQTADDEVRTLYSLRHTSLMYRIKYGGEINPLILAKNARTSVEMLERFYLSRMESGQFTDNLHAKKDRQRKKGKATFVTAPDLEPVDLQSMFAKAAERLPKELRSKPLKL